MAGNSYAALGSKPNNDVLPFLQASPSVSSIQTARTLVGLDNTTTVGKARKLGSLRIDSSTQLQAHKSKDNQLSDYQKNLVVGNPTMDPSAIKSFSRNFKKNLAGLGSHRVSCPPASRIRNDALKELDLTSQRSNSIAGLDYQLG